MLCQLSYTPIVLSIQVVSLRCIFGVFELVSLLGTHQTIQRLALGVKPNVAVSFQHLTADVACDAQ